MLSSNEEFGLKVCSAYIPTTTPGAGGGKGVAESKEINL